MGFNNMGKLSVLLMVMIWCWASIAEAEYVLYKDPQQPLNVRINDLLKRMTLEEKIGQMTQIERSVASNETMKNYFIDMRLNQHVEKSNKDCLFISCVASTSNPRALIIFAGTGFCSQVYGLSSVFLHKDWIVEQ